MDTLTLVIKMKGLSAYPAHTITGNRKSKTADQMEGTNGGVGKNNLTKERSIFSRIFLLVIILIPLVAVSQKAVTPPKILMVVSSYGKDGGKTRPGFEFDEYTQAYLIFASNGLLVDVASTKGGNAEPDEYNKTKPYNKTILSNKAAMDLLKRTKPTAAINAAAYDAVYIVGGKGAMFDLPYDHSLQDIISTIYNKKGIVSAVCHGAAAFVNVKLADGKYLVADRKIAGFTNEEEVLFGKKWKAEFPFLLEDRLIARAGLYEKSGFMLPHIAIDGQLITGQNPYSTTALAEAVVVALGKKLRYRKPYNDERTMNLVKRVVHENALEQAKKEIAKDTSVYDLKLLAVYGYYRLLGAKEDLIEVKLGLDIIELTTAYYYNASLEMERASAYKKLGDVAMAKKLLQDVIQKEPGLEAAKKALLSL